MSEPSRREWLAGLLAIGAGLIGLLCLAGVAVALFFASQLRSSPFWFLRAYQLQQYARAQPCSPDTHLVPGSYRPDPIQAAGPWLVVTYTADCAWSNQASTSIAGYSASSSQGSGCGGSGTNQASAPPAGGSVALVVESTDQCGDMGPAGAASLIIVTGQVVGAGVASAQAVFANGLTASAPVRAGRFVVLASTNQRICAVQALDAAGTALATRSVSAVGWGQGQGTCP